jgi:hypothetical protein
MELSSIFVVTVLSSFILLSNPICGQKLDFPAAACASGVESGNYWGCAARLAKSILGLHTWNEDTPINICGIDCTGNLKGRISRWRWVWDGRFRCDSKAPGIVGQHEQKGKVAAMNLAIKDFLNKAVASGHVKPDDFQC